MFSMDMIAAQIKKTLSAAAVTVYRNTKYESNKRCTFDSLCIYIRVWSSSVVYVYPLFVKINLLFLFQSDRNSCHHRHCDHRSHYCDYRQKEWAQFRFFFQTFVLFHRFYHLNSDLNANSFSLFKTYIYYIWNVTENARQGVVIQPGHPQGIGNPPPGYGNPPPGYNQGPAPY